MNTQMRGSINFYAGEIKEVSAQVRARNPNEVVVITKAKYSLKNIASGETVEDGTLDVDGDTVSVILNADEPGTFELKFSVTVGMETFIEKAIVRVAC